MAGASPSPIVVDGVWKRFRRGRRADTLRELAPALLKKLSRRGRVTDNEFWALRNLSFTVEPGEVLGIIGPNGAGKSTILSVLSRILWPDRGTASVTGRIGALIELAAAHTTRGRDGVEPACALLSSAGTLAGRAGLVSHVERIWTVRERLSPWKDTAEVRALDEQLVMGG